jgi:hypothetical protein
VLEISNDERLKCELERFGMQETRPSERDLLSPDQHKKVKLLTANDSIVIRKADKSNVFVIIDKEKYIEKLDTILADDLKFKKIDADPTEDIKRQLNKIITRANASQDQIHFSKLIGHFEPGYMYGNPKIHKCIEDPPLRPIISQVGTVSYDMSKQINSIIVKYMPKKFMVESTYEFLSILKTCEHNGTLASLDVESLFTNVPVHQTIDIILQNVYNHPDLAPPLIPRPLLKQLLEICTTKTPFRSVKGDLYVQSDGVSMGNPLGPTMANFYMCHLENSVFDNTPDIKPILYLRYVDDIFLLVNNISSIEKLRDSFEANSVLKFTFEVESKKQIPFLDVNIRRTQDSFSTSVHIKNTSFGDCLNFDSLCPDRYKVGVAKALLHRGYHVSSSWDSFHAEVNRIRQLLTNNNFPMALIDRTINNFVNQKFQDNPSITPRKKILLFFQNQMSTNYKTEEKQLEQIVHRNIQPVAATEEIKLLIYYRNRKLKDLLIRNKPLTQNASTADRHHVVYEYTCTRDGCSSSPKCYVGYTTATVWERFGMHTQTGSIKKHLVEHHDINRIPRRDLINDVKILRTCSLKRDLIFTEAILIKTKRPALNSQAEGCDRLLKLFKH